MTPATIAKIDRLAGRPLCALLTLLDWPRRLLAPARKTDPKKILFVKLVEMGSTVLACPAFEEAERKIGRDNLYILVFKPNRAIVDMLPFFRPENVITVDDTSLTAFIPSLLRALRRIRAAKIDTAIDMEGLTRASAIITRLTGARTRVGYRNFTAEGPYRGRLFTHELNYNFQHHVSRMFWALTRAAQADPREIPLLKETPPIPLPPLPVFQPEPEDLRDTARLIRQQGGHPALFPSVVLLNPNCSDLLPLRRWPTERFIELGQRLLAERDDVCVIVTGAPDETEGARAIAASIGKPPRVLSLAGHTTLRQLLTLYGLSRLLISNDSGPCHFASLAPVRVIALFGPETPLLYGPLGPGKRCVSAGLACSPCVNILNHRFSPCLDNRCMQAISVDEVHDLALELLDESPPGPAPAAVPAQDIS